MLDLMKKLEEFYKTGKFEIFIKIYTDFSMSINIYDNINGEYIYGDYIHSPDFYETLLKEAIEKIEKTILETTEVEE